MVIRYILLFTICAWRLFTAHLTLYPLSTFLPLGYEDLKYAAWPIVPIMTNDVDQASAHEYFRIMVCVADCAETALQNNPQFKEAYPSWKFFRYCIPDAVDDDSSMVPNFINGSETASRTINDLYQTWPFILGAAGAAILLSLLYTCCMSIGCCRKILVWGVLLLTVAGCGVLGYLFIQWAKTATTTPVDLFDRVTAAKAIGWTLVTVGVILLLILLFLRKRINFALNVIGATASALSQMKSLFFYPLLPVIVVLGYMVYWIIASMHLFSVKDTFIIPLPPAYDDIPEFQALPADQKTYHGYNWRDDFQYLFIYHFFHLLWTLQFIVYASYMTMSSALANWFFSLYKDGSSTAKQVGSGPEQFRRAPVCNAIFRIIRFHLGTVAFGSLIIAIIQMIRAVLTYIQKKTRNRNNSFVRCVLCCVQCCLKCVQKCVDYVSRNALIFSSITGDNFCVSACAAFGLIMSNILRAAAMSVVGTFIIFFGKLFISIIITTAAGFTIRYYFDEDEVFSIVMPLVAIFIVSYVVASLLLHTFRVSLETMFLCFLADTENRYTPQKIREAFDSAAKRAEEKNQELEMSNGVYSGSSGGKSSRRDRSDGYGSTRGGDVYQPSTYNSAPPASSSGTANPYGSPY